MGYIDRTFYSPSWTKTRAYAAFTP